tara:strand:- start:19800 stop:20462 length:663 start_codon:yes stop_codon:yes gene_type:complete
MKKIVIFGSSGHAKVIVDIIEKENKYKIVGYIDKNLKKGKIVFGYPVIGNDGEINDIVRNHSIKGGIIAVADNYLRYSIKNMIVKSLPKFNFITTIHPSSVISKNVSIGKGSAIMAGSIINPDSKIGNFCIVNTNASIDHDSIMEDFSSVGPKVVTGGNCKIGKLSFIGIGAVIIHDITIGEYSVIGANSTVLKNVGSSLVVYGNPSKVKRKRKVEEKYL